MLNLIKTIFTENDPLKKHIKKQTIFEAVVIKKINTNGYIVKINDRTAFMPRSLIGDILLCHGMVLPIELKIHVIIISIEDEKNVVVSAIGAQQKTLKELQLGDIKQAYVANIRNKQAYVDIQGCICCLPNKECALELNAKCKKVLSVGASIKVKIIDKKYIDKTDKETGLVYKKEEVTCSIKQQLPNPWDESISYSIGDTVKGIVRKNSKMGVVIELEPGIYGLLHSSKFVGDPSMQKSVLYKAGRIATVKVDEILLDKQRIGFSLPD